MCADSLVSLLPVLFDYSNDLFFKRRKDYSVIDDNGPDGAQETETEDRLVPMGWVLGGIAFSVTIGTILVWVVFGHDGIKPWATVFGFILGGMLSIIGCVDSAQFSVVFIISFSESALLARPT